LLKEKLEKSKDFKLEEYNLSDEELFKESLKLFLEKACASIVMLQRKFHIGFNSASEIVEKMEKLKYISPSNGPRPREVLITREDFKNLYGEEIKIKDENKEWQIIPHNNANRDFFKEALLYAVEIGFVSIAMLQRNFNIGYFQASNIIDKMEELNYISKDDENRLRKVNITFDEFKKMYGEQNDYN